MQVSPYSCPVASLAAGAFYVIGPGGDDDPKHALEQVVIVNTGTVAIRVGHSLTGMLTNARYTSIAALGSLPIEGPLDNLLIYNPDASTAAGFCVNARCQYRNSGQDGGVLAAQSTPGSTTRYTVIRPTKVAGATTVTTVPTKYRRTLTTIKGYSVTVATGATITIDLLNAGGASLLTSIMDAEAHTTKTLYTTTTLSAASGSLTIAPNEPLSLSFASSAGGDTVGDALIEIAHTVA